MSNIVTEHRMKKHIFKEISIYTKQLQLGSDAQWAKTSSYLAVVLLRISLTSYQNQKINKDIFFDINFKCI